MDPIKEATVVAIKSVLDPLLELMFDAGVTVQEFNKIARDRAVRMAMTRVIRESGRKSNSRVAIVTGLPRAEVTRILNAVDPLARSKSDHPARRVLAAWHDDANFLSPSGAPALLPIFGKKTTFEQLVEKHGGGIPVRAMLDELIQLDAVERIEDQLRAKVRVPILTGLNSRSIASVGERGRDLLATLAHNVRRKSQPFFEATAQIENGDQDIVTLVRREISEQGANFINSATSLLNRSKKKRKTKPVNSARTFRLGVTIFYFQDEMVSNECAANVASNSHRKNLRRRKRKPLIEDTSQQAE